MAAEPLPAPSTRVAFSRSATGRRERLGEPLLRTLTTTASIAAVLLVGLIVYKVLAEARPAMEHFGVGFIFYGNWNPVTLKFGSADFLLGSAESSLVALLLATPLAIAIALFLTELAPNQARRAIATLVELLAAIPSVVLGLWGLVVLGPLMRNSFEPALHSALGWLPLFSEAPSAVGMLLAIVVLTIMIVPIISSVTREIFLTVPNELKEGALALGATRWEMVRMVILPYSRSGMVGAVILGLGRALGEAIAVTMVIGHTERIGWGLFGTADTLASRIASEYQGATTSLQISSLAYLAAILLVLEILVNVVARLIVHGVAIPGAAGPGVAGLLHETEQ